MNYNKLHLLCRTSGKMYVCKVVKVSNKHNFLAMYQFKSASHVETYMCVIGL